MDVGSSPPHTTPPRSRPICGKHQLALSPDGTCVLCRREVHGASIPADAPGQRSWGKAVLLGIVGVAVASMAVVLLIRGLDLLSENQGPAATGALTSERATPSAAEPTEQELARLRSEIEVKLYATSWCKYCQLARKFFRKGEIRYTEIDIEKVSGAENEKNRLSPGSGVPVVTIDGEVVSGYQPDVYVTALARALKTRHDKQSQTHPN